MGTGGRLRSTLPAMAGRVVAAAGGWALGVAFGAAGRLRRGKPLHPRGVVHPATFVGGAGARPRAVPLLDERHETPCVVRVSRAAGLPAPLPDIHGLALRLDLPQGQVDLLFATTGTGRVTRYVLRPRRSARHPMTTLMPLRTPQGALHLGLAPVRPGEWQVTAATPRDRRWMPVGRLVAGSGPVGPDPDPPIRFDPVRNVPPGTATYRWVRLVRDPAYVMARRWSPARVWRT